MQILLPVIRSEIDHICRGCRADRKNRRNTFTSLHEGTRRTILETAVREIVLLLEQNILAKFKLTPEMQQREERKLVELGGWKNILYHRFDDAHSQSLGCT